jgi:hypothetical protein
MTTQDLDHPLDLNQFEYERTLEARERAIKRLDTLLEERRRLDGEAKQAGDVVSILTMCARLLGERVRK